VHRLAYCVRLLSVPTMSGELTLTNSISLYERLGGDGAIKAVVDRFYQRVTGDPDLAPYFTGVNLTQLRRHQAAFVSQATGGPTDYAGRDMATTHAGLNITGPAFDHVVGHLAETLREFQVRPGEIDEVVALLGPLREQVVTA
jgi:hemoglobin